MENNQVIKRRRSIRLKGYDYSTSGLYFITICTWNHVKLFGKTENDRMIISRYGVIAEKKWLRTEELRAYISLHEYIIMPNHIHGIVEIVNHQIMNCRGTACRAQGMSLKEQFGKPTIKSIPTTIRSYKAAVTKCIRGRMNNSYSQIWQKNYFEHIIRNEESYLKISEYIMTNTRKWSLDKNFV